jgi:hypothetical protein
MSPGAVPLPHILWHGILALIGVIVTLLTIITSPGSMLFLTSEFFAIQSAYMAVALWQDLLPSTSPSNTALLNVVRRRLFALSFPLGMIVMVLFWILVFPDPRYPSLHVPILVAIYQHAVVPVVVLVEWATLHDEYESWCVNTLFFFFALGFFFRSPRCCSAAAASKSTLQVIIMNSSSTRQNGGYQCCLGGQTP